jgi:hypothetical protein
MAPTKQNAARKPSANDEVNPVQADVDDVSATDYTDNMFRDGNNRVAHITQARAYDNAAHTQEANDEASYGNAGEAETLLDQNLDATDDAAPEKLLALKQDTSRSRDGTDASGSLDESGGFLGGETREVDSLEASAMPVDKIPHMHD